MAFVVLSLLTVFFYYLGLAYPPAPGDVGNAIYVIVFPLILTVATGWRYAKAVLVEFYETSVKVVSRGGSSRDIRYSDLEIGPLTGSGVFSAMSNPRIEFIVPPRGAFQCITYEAALIFSLSHSSSSSLSSIIGSASMSNGFVSFLR